MIHIGLVGIRWLTVRRVVAVACVVLATLLVPSEQPPSTLDWRLAAVARSSSFDLWSWEFHTLTKRAAGGLFDPSSPTGPDAVRRYVQLSGREAQARRERDDAWARQSVSGLIAGLNASQQNVDRLDAELEQLRPEVETTLSREIESELQRQDVRTGWVTWSHLQGFPFFRPELVPGVFFQLGPLPDLLVVAPRDRIELIGSILLQPGLAPRQIDSLEGRADRLDVSSVVVGIGGLAAYPSMVPDDQSVHDLVITVSHEWTHHYLALRPLGMAYFNSYQMREINETVADMVGHEVGNAVYRRYYAPSAPPANPPPAAMSQPISYHPDFWTLMRGIRVTVEGYLARHDVAGADAYMVQAQQDLASQGYYVRRLNTAYLAFFGSYAETANPFEPKLRQLREQSGSLDAFLNAVSQARSPSDLDQLIRESANHRA